MGVLHRPFSSLVLQKLSLLVSLYCLGEFIGLKREMCHQKTDWFYPEACLLQLLLQTCMQRGVLKMSSFPGLTCCYATALMPPPPPLRVESSSHSCFAGPENMTNGIPDHLRAGRRSKAKMDSDFFFSNITAADDFLWKSKDRKDSELMKE